MAPKFDVIAALSQDSSPRVAGSEGEQKAALFIADQFKKLTHFSTEIDEFNMNASTYLTKGIFALAVIVFSVLAFVPVVGIVFVNLSLVAAILYILEDMSITHLAAYFKHGSSQNVVTHYVPRDKKSTPRSRKIVFLAHYDALRVKPLLLQKCEQLPVPLSFTLAVAMVAIPVFTFIHSIVHENLALSIILQIVVVIAWLIALIPVVRLVTFLGASVSPSANCNASGVAAMLELAHRISEAQDRSQESATIHGMQAAYEAGVVPDDAQLTYHGDTNEMQPLPENVSRDDAGLSCVDTPHHEILSADTPASEVLSQDGAPESTSADGMTLSVTSSPVITSAVQPSHLTSSAVVASLGSSSAEKDVPTWFKTAQEKAKKVAKPLNNSLRSRFADTGSAALKAQAEHVATTDYAQENNTAANITTACDASGIHESSSSPDVATTNVVPVQTPHEENASAPDTSAYPNQMTIDEFRTQAASSASSKPYAASGNAANQSDSAQHKDAHTPATSPIANLASQESHSIQQAFNQPEPNCSFMENWSDTATETSSSAPAATMSASTDSTSTATAADISASMVSDSVDRSDQVVASHNQERILVSSVQQELSSNAGSVERDEEQPGNAAKPSTTTEMEVVQAKENALDALYDTSALSETNDMKQPAPLATEAHSAESHRQLSGVIPRIDPLAARGDHPSRSGMIRDMRGVLPSLSGTITRVKDTYENSPLNPVGSFAAGATESIKPITDEMLKDVSPDEMYVEDADDSDVEENYTDSGAPAGPDYVEMPQSRWQRFKQRFSRKKKQQHEYDDFDRPLGSTFDSSTEDDFDAIDEPHSSSVQGNSVEGETRSSSPTTKRTQAQTRSQNVSHGEQWEGGAFSFDELSAAFTNSTSAAMDDIYTFKNGGYNTEIWFVALGASAYDNGGVRAFYEKYAQQLHGAIFVDIEALGAGDLSLIYGDGSLKSTVTSGRLKRYVKKAQHVLQHPITEFRVCACELPGQVAAHLGCQHIQLAGTVQGSIAYYATKDDTDQIISEETLEENINYLCELARTI